MNARDDAIRKLAAVVELAASYGASGSAPSNSHANEIAGVVIDAIIEVIKELSREEQGSAKPRDVTCPFCESVFEL
jgi:hypothetical protein